MSLRLAAVVAAALFAAACYRSAAPEKPDPRVVELEKRVAMLEQQVERIGELSERVSEIAGQVDEYRDRQEQLSSPGEERVAGGGGGEIDDDTRRRLAEIGDQLDAIEREIQSRGGPGARRRAPSPRRHGPDPKVTYSVPVKGSPHDGPRYAKVTIVKAFEFACPFCHRVRPTLEQLRKDYGKDLRIVYKHLIVHPRTATVPAHAACAAHRQGKFEQMSDLIWDKGFSASPRDLSQQNMEKLAGEIGLDIAQLKADMNGPCKKIVAADQQLMRKLGAYGTPSFFINGRFLSGARPIGQFKKLIDAELAKANQRIRQGTRLRDYYSHWVVTKGKPSP